ncbi:Ubiquitin [Cynara cardunculus var. scolymus]|uniref:Ubiquitin n=1 Tax=Cynara cardunculus var. scolymus TaxID=59895 RepID=A0A103YMF2_CYNCS|nr:Ubiquitin [Cynara cardunculus var. scolymus]
MWQIEMEAILLQDACELALDGEEKKREEMMGQQLELRITRQEKKVKSTFQLDNSRTRRVRNGSGAVERVYNSVSSSIPSSEKKRRSIRFVGLIEVETERGARKGRNPNFDLTRRITVVSGEIDRRRLQSIIVREAMYIRVKRNKTTYFLQCDATEKVLDIKQKLHSLIDQPVNDQRLILAATGETLLAIGKMDEMCLQLQHPATTTKYQAWASV